MYGILLSAFNSTLGFVFRGIALKFIIAFLLYWAVSLMAENLIPLLPNKAVFTSALSQIPPGVWYFLDFFEVSIGLSLVITAYASRFVIRRIPFIG